MLTVTPPVGQTDRASDSVPRAGAQQSDQSQLPRIWRPSHPTSPDFYQSALAPIWWFTEERRVRPASIADLPTVADFPADAELLAGYAIQRSHPRWPMNRTYVATQLADTIRPSGAPADMGNGGFELPAGGYI
jgi:hypothetical protein